jgi:glutamate-1-semialdehyde 2,1-aminomutase
MVRGLYDSIDDRREKDERFQACANAVTGMLTMFYTRSVRNGAEARESDVKRYLAFHRALMDEGFWLPPSPFEAWFLSAAHTAEDVDRFCEVAAEHL